VASKFGAVGTFILTGFISIFTKGTFHKNLYASEIQDDFSKESGLFDNSFA
jgi:hypothetical protein